MRNINVYAVDYKIDKATYEDGVTRNYHDALKEIRRIKKCIRPTEITLRVLTDNGWAVTGWVVTKTWYRVEKGGRWFLSTDS